MPRYFNPRAVAAPASRYSHGVAHSAQARRLVISGQVGIRPDGSVPGDLDGQMEAAWDNLITVLHEGGMTVADLIKVTTYVTVPDSIAAVRAVRQRKLGQHAPAATHLIVAGLATPAFLFEVEGEAISEDMPSIFDDMPGTGAEIGSFRGAGMKEG
jgi:enamine deaminase RidA (YjgF/YER057c/UK114 family)